MHISEIAWDQNPWWAAPQTRLMRHFQERRDLFASLRSAILAPGQTRAQVLLGPRQVGKSTLLLQVIESLLDEGVPAQNVMFFDFSDDRLAPRSVSPRELLDPGNPEPVANAPRYFFLDEITWAKPGWDRWLKQAVDSSRRAGAHSGARYLVTSSASSLLRDASLESGQGRWDDHFLEGMTFPEYRRLSHSRDPELVLRYLRSGGYPGQLWEDDPGLGRRRLREDIIDRAILHDLIGHGVDVPRVKALFTYLVQVSGSQWEAGNRAQDLDADPRTVAQWLRLLEQTGLLSILPRWTPGKSGKAGKASSELRLHPKVFAADHALVLCFASTVDDPQVQGRVFEAIVYRHLRSLGTEGVTVAYFRTDDRYEIDFVVSRGEERIGVEVTSGKTVDDRKISRLVIAGEKIRAKRLLLVYGGASASERHGVKIIPIHSFLSDHASTLDWSAG